MHASISLRDLCSSSVKTSTISIKLDLRSFSCASPMMEQISKLREKYELHMKVERYVSDETGIPDSDKVFIKD